MDWLERVARRVFGGVAQENVWASLQLLYRSHFWRPERPRYCTWMEEARRRSPASRTTGPDHRRHRENPQRLFCRDTKATSTVRSRSPVSGLAPEDIQPVSRLTRSDMHKFARYTHW